MPFAPVKLIILSAPSGEWLWASSGKWFHDEENSENGCRPQPIQSILMTFIGNRSGFSFGGCRLCDEWIAVYVSLPGHSQILSHSTANGGWPETRYTKYWFYLTPWVAWKLATCNPLLYMLRTLWCHFHIILMPKYCVVFFWRVNKHCLLGEMGIGEQVHTNSVQMTSWDVA